MDVVLVVKMVEKMELKMVAKLVEKMEKQWVVMMADWWVVCLGYLLVEGSADG